MMGKISVSAYMHCDVVGCDWDRVVLVKYDHDESDFRLELEKALSLVGWTSTTAHPELHDKTKKQITKFTCDRCRKEGRWVTFDEV